MRKLLKKLILWALADGIADTPVAADLDALAVSNAIETAGIVKSA